MTTELPANTSREQIGFATNTSRVHAADPDAPSPFRALFGAVACLSLFGNLLLCVVMVRRRSMLRKTYNVLILNLACADSLTGLFLLITPRYVVSQEIFYPLEGVKGDMFCRFFWSTYFLFLFGKASNASIMCLAIDRWYSILRPIRYKIAFGQRRLLGYIALTWVTSAVTECIGLFNVTERDGVCVRISPFYGKRAEQVFILVHVIVTFYLPSLVTWCSFAHIWHNMSRTVTCQAAMENSSVVLKRRLVRMCALAAFFLTLCWFPTETFFVLKHEKVLELSSGFYWGFNLLAMFSSCINPWLYCLSNRTYRREFMALLLCMPGFQTGGSSWQPTATLQMPLRPSQLRAWGTGPGLQELGFRNCEESETSV
ncbi:G-protein coupled receptor 83 [Nematostella vectensis]|uniref:G-protein coupled receptor 83 n=1 Tax=Nematostella vectensis TaxID=45351 RepID=UPI0020774361|nr:G-protein coupled receptor 83 [Nematostella vectensis]XP_032243343.2 G-protein coupled receptor 83 [Nematostella vectensis]